MKLKDLVTIIHNDVTSVVLEVKKGHERDLIFLGCFNGDETMFRLTKGKNRTCTVWTKNGNSYSWHWGEGGYTLVSDQMRNMGHMIQSCILIDFGICLEGKGIADTLYLTPPEHRKDEYVMMWWNGQTNVVVHRNGDFYSGFLSKEDFEKKLTELGYTYTTSELYHSPRTGCCMMDYHAEM